jgi:hypothetical protein
MSPSIQVSSQTCRSWDNLACEISILFLRVTIVLGTAVYNRHNHDQLATTGITYYVPLADQCAHVSTLTTPQGRKKRIRYSESSEFNYWKTYDSVDSTSIPLFNSTCASIFIDRVCCSPNIILNLHFPGIGHQLLPNYFSYHKNGTYCLAACR